MKRLILGLAVLAVGVGQVQGEPSLTIDDGLIAHYTFDGTSGAVVNSAGPYNGTNYGAVRGVPGKVGNAFQFDGADDYVDTLPPSELSGAISIALWIYPTDYQQIFGSIENASGGKDGFVLGHNDDEFVGLQYYSGNISRGLTETSVGSVFADTWNHLVCVIDQSANASIYVNGALDASTTFTAPTTSHDRNLMFGEGILSQNLEFEGLMDDVKIWDRALSATEVAQVANVVPEPSTFIIWALLGTLAIGYARWRRR